MSEVDRSGWIVNLGGRDYATWPYALDEAHKYGLTGIHCELIQIPDKENQQTAIMKATASFAGEDGKVREFSAYGDASPANVGSRIATALIRMAETRAKGRALRDACNIGMTLLEELPPDEKEARANGAGHASVPVQPGVSRPGSAGGGNGAAPRQSAGAAAGSSAKGSAGPAIAPPLCEIPGCGRGLTVKQRAASLQEFGKLLCRQHQQETVS